MEIKHGNSIAGIYPVEIKYGQEISAGEKWKEIIAIQDNKEMQQKVDELLEIFCANSSENGFIDDKQQLDINILFSRFVVLDDKELYYMFFEQLKNNFDKKQELFANKQDIGIIDITIRQTIKNYFGEITGNSSLRNNLTYLKFDKDDNAILPSIKNLKNQNCAECVEISAVAHNLFLLTGQKSHYVLSRAANFNNSNDGHAFVILEGPNKCILYDLAQATLKAYQTNPVQDILNNKDFIVNGNYYVNQEENILNR